VDFDDQLRRYFGDPLDRDAARSFMEIAERED